MRNVPPVFCTSSPVMSIENMYLTCLAAATWLCSHCRLPPISVMKRKVIVRAGGATLPSRIAVAKATAISAPVATPLALSLAPGSWTCAAITIRSSGATRPGISAISDRTGAVENWLATVT